MTSPGTRYYLLAAIAFAGLGAAGCGRSQGTPTASSPAPATTIVAPSVTPTTTVTSTPTGSVSVTSSSSPTSAAVTTPDAVRACTSDQITTTYGPVDHGAGNAYLVLLFTNTSQMSCTLQGFPGAAGLDSSGHQKAQAVRVLGGLPKPPPTVLLQPNTVASATIHGASVGNGDQQCPAFASLLVTPPNTTRSVPVTEALASCSFEVYPVVPGSSGSTG